MAKRLAQLNGTRVQGAVQITGSALNDLLGAAMTSGKAPTVQLLDANRIEVRYGIIHVRAELPTAIDAGPAPRLTVALASTVVAWALRATLREPFVEVHGKQVTIHLAAVPALASLRLLWPHVMSARLSTAPDVLRVELGILINDGVTHA